jgi:hypothetical protein
MKADEIFGSIFRSRFLSTIVFCIFISIAKNSSGQVSKPEYLIRIKPELMDVYLPDSMSRNKVILYTDFNSDQILNEKKRLVYADKGVVKVELVYSTYRLSNTFNQPELNRKRLESLQKISPELFNSSIIEWKFIGQTKAKTDEEAKKLFHGFVITFIPLPAKESSKSDVMYLSYMIHSDSLGKDSVVLKEKIRLKKKNHFTGLYYPRSDRKRVAGILYTRKSIWNRKPKYTFSTDTIVRLDSSRIFVPSTTAFSFIRNMDDSVVLKVLDRKKEWSNILFVCDVTGSMAPYSAEILVWNKLNFNTGRGKYFTFFNDGDNMDDRKKVIGRTGGIYHVEANSVEDVEEKALYTIRKGNGGDSPENDLEALISAINHFPAAKEIVLIADNWAAIKDIELIDKIKKPVHVILCGVFNGLVNADYVELAYRSKGSLHTMEEDIDNLALMNEGETIKIGSNTFKLEKGKFILVHEM